jgi:hypothetical protein
MHSFPTQRVQECFHKLWEQTFVGNGGGRGEGFANHRCVQVLQGGEPGNNFQMLTKKIATSQQFQFSIKKKFRVQ